MRRLPSLACALAAPVVLSAQLPDSTACASPAPTSAAQPSTIPIDVFSNHVYVKVCAGDRPLDFILDTGAGATFLDLHTAERFGIKLGGSFTGRGAGAGTIAGAQLEGATVRLAGSALVQPVPSALDISRLPPREGHRMDGILGYDFIRRFVVAIDYVKQELRLYDPRTFKYDGPGESIPITFSNNHPHVDAEVRLADGTSLKGRMVVDVGSSGSLALTQSFSDANHLRDRVGKTIHRRSGGGVGGAVTADVGRVEALRLGALVIARPVTSLPGDSAGVMSGNAEWVGNIGGEILRRFTVYLDYPNRRMILEPHAGTSEPFEADMSGVGFVMNDSLTRAAVDYVVPGSPAMEAGLTVGDTLMTIDGQPANGPAVREMRKRFRRDGERIVLTVRRGGETRTITLVTRRLV
jgi:predicted aspartyl protease